MYASAANYGLAATLRARADGAGPSRVYPSGSTPSQSQTQHDPDSDYQVLSSRLGLGLVSLFHMI